MGASVMIQKFVSELLNLNHTRFNRLVARLSLKFADEFQGRDTSLTESENLGPESERHGEGG